MKICVVASNFDDCLKILQEKGLELDEDSLEQPLFINNNEYHLFGLVTNRIPKNKKFEQVIVSENVQFSHFKELLSLVDKDSEKIEIAKKPTLEFAWSFKN